MKYLKSIIIIFSIIGIFSCKHNNSTIIEKDGKLQPYDSTALIITKLPHIESDLYIYEITYKGGRYLVLNGDRCCSIIKQ